jgi:hypothetical protein
MVMLFYYNLINKNTCVLSNFSDELVSLEFNNFSTKFFVNLLFMLLLHSLF